MFTKRDGISKKVVVIGAGSVGERHIRILEEMGCRVALVSRHVKPGIGVFSDTTTAIHETDPDYVVIANETSQHFDNLREVRSAGYSGVVIVEKPLFDRVIPKISELSENVYVGYNLRFHPLLKKLKELAQEQRVISVNVYVGKYLPEWRPGNDYSKSYSAQTSKGGGALRDLSHEIDLTLWICGDWLAVAALGGHFSSLKIETDDIFQVLIRGVNVPVVSVHMNYLDRIGQRTVTMITDSETIKVDFIANTIQRNGVVARFEVERDATYRVMHSNLLSGDLYTVCTFPEAMRVLELIEAAERASSGIVWVEQ